MELTTSRRRPMRATRVGVAVIHILTAFTVLGVAIGAWFARDLATAGLVILEPAETWTLVRLLAAAPWLVVIALVQGVAVVGVLADRSWGVRLGVAVSGGVVVLAAAAAILTGLGHDPLAVVGSGSRAGGSSADGIGILAFLGGAHGLALVGLARLAGRDRPTTRRPIAGPAAA